jgi:hypothetical protein
MTGACLLTIDAIAAKGRFPNSRAGMQRKIQKLKNNGSKSDKYQIFFVPLHQ